MGHTMGHIPVLLNEVLTVLHPQGGVFVDATLGGGGHSREILKALIASGDNFQWVGIDQDEAILAQTSEQLKAEFSAHVDRLHFVHANFGDLAEIIKGLKIPAITGGVLADIGVSSFQLDQGERGFSFNKTAPLDMRMNADTDQTAAEVVNTYSEVDLVRIFSDYGEERLSKTIARAIVDSRKRKPLETTTDLALLIAKCYQQKLGNRPLRIHPATCVFQALRIEVNQELVQLERFLNGLPEVLSSGARVAVISFHSLEDRIVKHTLKNLAGKEGPLRLIDKKPVTPSKDEVRRNPRSRSAKLRTAEKI